MIETVRGRDKDRHRESDNKERMRIRGIHSERDKM